MTTIAAETLPKLRTTDGKLVALLDGTLDFKVTDELVDSQGGVETLTFSVPYDHPNRGEIEGERIVEVEGRQFIIDRVTDVRDEEGGEQTVIEAEALWYELAEDEPVSTFVLFGVTPRQVLDHVLTGTGWRSGTVDIALVNDFILKEAATPLGVLRFMAQVYTAEIRFNMDRTVDFVSKVETPSDLFFAYSRDLVGVSRTEDVSELTTRLYPYGGGAIGISSVNGDKAYLEDYSFYDSRGLPRRTRVTILKHPRIYIASSLLDWAQRKIKELAQPRMTYEVSLAILDADQVPVVGQYVRVWDEPLDMNVYPRVVGREYYPLEPWRTTLSLDTRPRSIVDAMQEERILGQDSVGTGELAPASVTSDILSEVGDPYGPAIRPGHIDTNAVQAQHISVANLSAITAVMGSLTAGNISLSPTTVNGQTVESYIRSSVTSTYVEMNKQGIEAFRTTLQNLHISGTEGVALTPSPDVSYAAAYRDAAITWHARPVGPSQRLEELPETGFLAGYETAGLRSTVVGANMRAGNAFTFATLGVFNRNTGTYSSSVVAQHSASGKDYVRAVAGRHQAIILDESGNSGFLLRGASYNRGQVRIGLSRGGFGRSGPIYHGLGTIPFVTLGQSMAYGPRGIKQYRFVVYVETITHRWFTIAVISSYPLPGPIQRSSIYVPWIAVK